MNMQELYTRNQQMSTQFACLCAFCNSTQKAQKAHPPFGHLAQNPASFGHSHRPIPFRFPHCPCLGKETRPILAVSFYAYYTHHNEYYANPPPFRMGEEYACLHNFQGRRHRTMPLAVCEGLFGAVILFQVLIGQLL